MASLGRPKTPCFSGGRGEWVKKWTREHAGQTDPRRASFWATNPSASINRASPSKAPTPCLHQRAREQHPPPPDPRARVGGPPVACPSPPLCLRSKEVSLNASLLSKRKDDTYYYYKSKFIPRLAKARAQSHLAHSLDVLFPAQNTTAAVTFCCAVWAPSLSLLLPNGTLRQHRAARSLILWQTCHPGFS